MYNGSTRGEEREKGEEKLFEEIMVENSSNLMKTLIYIYKKLNELQVGKMQTDPHPNTS